MRSKPIINLRYKSVAQLNRIKRAAKLKHWSLNTFVLNAADDAAKTVIVVDDTTEAMIQKSNEETAAAS